MEININPSRINTSRGTGKTTERRKQQDAESAYTVPKRSEVNYIPVPETLRTLISSAIAALRSGVYWDRGTILNLLV